MPLERHFFSTIKVEGPPFEGGLLISARNASSKIHSNIHVKTAHFFAVNPGLDMIIMNTTGWDANLFTLDCNSFQAYILEELISDLIKERNKEGKEPSCTQTNDSSGM